MRAIYLFALFASLTAVPLLAQGQLQFVGEATSSFSVARVIPLSGGLRVVIGSQVVPSPLNAAGMMETRTGLFVYGLGADGHDDLKFGPLFNLIGGNGNDVAADAAVDPNGNIWIVGSTDSDDFPLLNALYPSKAPYSVNGFVLELDPAGQTVLFSSFLGGEQTKPNGYSKATNIAFDTSGNAYILGNSNAVQFPATPGAFQIGTSLQSLFRGVVYTFLMKLSPAGKLIYSTILGGSSPNCFQGNGCVDFVPSTIGTSLAVDSSGAVTVAGVTSALDFPVTPGAYQTQCGCRETSLEGFISKFSPDGSHLVWSTYFDGEYSGSSPELWIAQDTGDNVFAFGRRTPPEQTNPYFNAVPLLFAAKLKSDGSGLVYSTQFGSSLDVDAAGIAVDSEGNAWMAGRDSSPLYPSFAAVGRGSDFVVSLNAAGTSPMTVYRLPTGTVTQPPSIVAANQGAPEQILLANAKGSVLELPLADAFSKPAVLGLGNAATYVVDTGGSPGELLSLYGVGLGPQSGVNAVPDVAGHFPTVLGGVRVLIGGIAAPLLYVGPDQINLQIPYETEATYINSTPIEVDAPAATIRLTMRGLPSLGLFYAGAPPSAAAINQDGTVNSAANPAKPGSIVTLFGTGAYWASGSDGLVANGATLLAQHDNMLRVTDQFGDEAAILYAGTAPGQINGVFQLNMQLPESEFDPVLTLTSVRSFGMFTSNSVQVYAH